MIAFTDRIIKKYRIKATSLKQRLKELSGGNIQKLIVAREIEMEKPLLICCEPTRGIDIGAIEFIHDCLVEHRSKGGVLLVSSELSEILDLSDRIYVMYEGCIVGEFARCDATAEQIGKMMLGGGTEQ